MDRLLDRPGGGTSPVSAEPIESLFKPGACSGRERFRSDQHSEFFIAPNTGQRAQTVKHLVARGAFDPEVLVNQYLKPVEPGQ